VSSISVRLQWLRLGSRHQDLAVRSVIFLDAICEIDRLSVGRPARRGAAPLRVGDEMRIGAVGVHHKNLVAVSAAIGCECDLPTVGRPRRPAVEEGIVSKVAQIRAVGIGHKNFRVLFPNDFAERDLFHVGRPRSVSVNAARNDRRDFLRRKINNVNLRLVLLRRREIVVRAIHNLLAVGRPVWVNRIVLFRREHINVAAGRIHHRDAGPLLGDENERDLLPVRRPGRIFVVGIIARELREIFAVGIHREELFLAGDDRDEDEFLAIR